MNNNIRQHSGLPRPSIKADFMGAVAVGILIVLIQFALPFFMGVIK